MALAFRARLILRRAQPDKPTNDQVATELGCDLDTVSRWRFRRRHLDGVNDLPRSGRPAALSPEDRQKVVIPATTRPAHVGILAARR